MNLQKSDRRSFLRAAAASAAGAAFLPQALASGARCQMLPGEPGKNLVLVQLSGGNDGLATVIPHGDDELRRRRRTTVHKASEVLKLDDYRGLNPGLRSLRGRFDQGQMAIVEGCGYPDAIRSHFKSYEVWHTGHRAGRISGDGWVGRLASTCWAEEPRPDRVVHFGGKAPYSLFSREQPPVALASPTGYRWFGDEDAYARGGAAICEHEMEQDPRHVGRDDALQRLRATLDDARESSGRIRGAAATYRTEVEYPKTPLSAGLRDVAALVNARSGTQIFSVADRGYDTHSRQRQAHDRKMQELGDALGAFLEDLDRSEAGRDTVVLVFSEFGRRVAENGSSGHDHGKAGPMFVLGHSVKGGLYGAHPSLTQLDAGDLAFTTDFRSVYATLIGGLFGADPARVLGAEYPLLPLI